MYEVYYDQNVYLIYTLWDKLKQCFDPAFHGQKKDYVHNLSVDPVEGESTGAIEGSYFVGPNKQQHFVKDGVWERI